MNATTEKPAEWNEAMIEEFLKESGRFEQVQVVFERRAVRADGGVGPVEVVFPDEASCLRLLRAAAAEQHEARR
jgi:hypothetical protein